MKLTNISTAVVAFALTASAASAQVTVQGAHNGVPAESVFAGSDTFNLVMDVLLNLDNVASNGEIPGLSYGKGGPGLNEGVTSSYQGVGSSNGEKYTLGVAGTQVPLCTLAPGSTVNTGCQEVVPMSRALQKDVCNKAEYNPTTNPNTVAEGLAVANDGLVVIGANANHQQYSTGACTTLTSTPNNAVAADYTMAAPASGHLADSGVIPGTAYTLGAGMTKKWQDVLRLVYTGCKQGDGTCVPAVLNPARCNTAERNALLDNYGTLFKGANCAGPGTCTQLRKAYRRDDGSGTTGVFLETIGVAANSFDSANTRRTVGLNGFTGIKAGSDKHPFCDGMDFEGVLPLGGDPIRRACAAEDDICGNDGKIGVVRAIISTPSGTALAYPTNQCTRGAYALTKYFASGFKVCPDGNAPIGGDFCFAPFYNAPGGRNFNCITDKFGVPPGAPATFDPRVYNAFMRDAVTGAVQLAAPSLPRQANWRENMINIISGPFSPKSGPYAASQAVCQLDDATQNIGCLVGNTTCAWGFAGRETAALTSAKQNALGVAPGTTVDLSLKNEAFSINGAGPTNAAIGDLSFPFARELFFNSPDGFENLSARCASSGRTATYCADELKIALAFYNNTVEVQNAFANNGYIPVAAPVCRGAQSTTATPTTAACGAANPLTDAAGRPMQALNACLPQ